MASKLESAITAIKRANVLASSAEECLEPRCLLICVLLYLVAMLSVPVDSLAMLLWFAIIPPIAAPLLRLSFGGIFAKSLIAVPFAVLIGLFNPIYNSTIAFTVMRMPISYGWLEFVTIIVRAMLSVQAVLLLIDSCGFVGMCRSLERIGVPRFLTTQLLMVYRYIEVILEEALVMRRAREARGAGGGAFRLRMWGEFVGQLFLRSLERSRRVYRAMLARGFTGTFPVFSLHRSRWKWRDTATLAVFISLMLILRLVNLSALFIIHNS